MRFEYYLRLFKECKFVIGNSSVGIRVGSVYGKSTIDIGTRQQHRSNSKNIIHVNEHVEDILDAINAISSLKTKRTYKFGKGNSAEKFIRILSGKRLWQISSQKIFIDQLSRDKK